MKHDEGILDFLEKHRLAVYETLEWNQKGYVMKDGDITHLGLYGFHLNEIPDIIFNLKAIRFLSLIYNNISGVPGSIGKLTELEELYIGGNSIELLPDEIGSLKKLRYLYIMEDNLTRLNDTLAGLKNPDEFVVSSKRLKLATEEIRGLGVRARTLMINDKKITFDE